VKLRMETEDPAALGICAEALVGTAGADG
jgi:hypothetical protein